MEIQAVRIFSSRWFFPAACAEVKSYICSRSIEMRNLVSPSDCTNRESNQIKYTTLRFPRCFYQKSAECGKRACAHLNYTFWALIKKCSASNYAALTMPVPIWRQFSHTEHPLPMQCVLRVQAFLFIWRARESCWNIFSGAREDSIHCCRSTKDENTAHRCARSGIETNDDIWVS